MKSSIESQGSSKLVGHPVYPCLMKLTGLSEKVVLATGRNGEHHFKGVVVVPGDEPCHDIGMESNDWLLRAFEPLQKGRKVILEND